MSDEPDFEDLVAMFQWRNVMDGMEDHDKVLAHRNKAMASRKSGNIWEYYKGIRECFEGCCYYHHGTMAEECLMACYFEAEVERAVKLKYGMVDKELPRFCGDYEEAVKKAREHEECLRDKESLYYKITVAIKLVNQGKYKEAFEFIKSKSDGSFIVGGVIENQADMINAYKSSIETVFRMNRFRNLITFIANNETEDILEHPDSQLVSILSYNLDIAFYAYTEYAEKVYNELCQRIIARERERAVVLCKRYLSVQKCSGEVDGIGSQDSITGTERLLKHLMNRPMEELMVTQDHKVVIIRLH